MEGRQRIPPHPSSVPLGRRERVRGEREERGEGGREDEEGGRRGRVMISSRPVCVSFCAASDGVRGVVGELNPSLTRRRVGEEDLSALCERFGGYILPLGTSW